MKNLLPSQVAMSSALKLVEIEGKGRGFVSVEPLEGGQVVLRESPILIFSAYPLKRDEHQEDGSSYARYCAHCYRSLVLKGSGVLTALTCPSCSHPDDAVFCSAECKSLALESTHSPWACKALNYLRNCPLLFDNQPADRQVQARYLVTAYNLAIVSPSVFKTLLSLHGDGKRYMEIASFLHPIISSFATPVRIPDFSIEMTACLLDKEMNNSFNLLEPARESGERGIRAYGIYPNVSFFNHSCMPNACRFEYLDSGNEGNTDLIIRLMHDVPQGMEICLSYVRVNRNYSDRKKRLLDYFGFVCLCDRCKVEANSSHEDCSESNCNNNKITLAFGNSHSKYAEFAMKFVCDNENCGGTLAPMPASDVLECNYCGSLQNRSR